MRFSSKLSSYFAFLLMMLLLSQTAREEPAYAEQPEFCEKQNFLSKETSLPERLVYRGHAFRVGQATLVGLAIGFSPVNEVMELARSITSGASEANGFHTWYFSSDYEFAASKFNDYDLPSPALSELKDIDRTTLVDAFDHAFTEMLDPERPRNFINALETDSFLALGCDAERHRGPTVFGMVLAASGCSSQQAAEIVNTVWGLNTVPEDLRLEIIERASKIGDAHPLWRERLRRVLSGTLEASIPLPQNNDARNDLAYFEMARENAYNQPIRKSFLENLGLNFYRAVAYNPHMERKPSFKALLEKAANGLSYNIAAHESFMYWNARMTNALEQDAYRYEPAYFEERIKLAEFYLNQTR